MTALWRIPVLVRQGNEGLHDSIVRKGTETAHLLRCDMHRQRCQGLRPCIGLGFTPAAYSAASATSLAATNGTAAGTTAAVTVDLAASNTAAQEAAVNLSPQEGSAGGAGVSNPQEINRQEYLGSLASHSAITCPRGGPLPATIREEARAEGLSESRVLDTSCCSNSCCSSCSPAAISPSHGNGRTSTADTVSRVFSPKSSTRPCSSGLGRVSQRSRTSSSPGTRDAAGLYRVNLAAPAPLPPLSAAAKATAAAAAAIAAMAPSLETNEPCNGESRSFVRRPWHTYWLSGFLIPEDGQHLDTKKLTTLCQAYYCDQYSQHLHQHQPHNRPSPPASAMCKAAPSPAAVLRAATHKGGSIMAARRMSSPGFCTAVTEQLRLKNGNKAADPALKLTASSSGGRDFNMESTMSASRSCGSLHQPDLDTRARSRHVAAYNAAWSAVSRYSRASSAKDQKLVRRVVQSYGRQGGASVELGQEEQPEDGTHVFRKASRACLMSLVALTAPPKALKKARFHKIGTGASGAARGSSDSGGGCSDGAEQCCAAVPRRMTLPGTQCSSDELYHAKHET